MTENCDTQRFVPQYSTIAEPKGPTAVGEILALAARPEVISFAGGLPSPEGFPAKAIEDATDYVLETNAKTALQYSTAIGTPELREAIAKIETEHGCPTSVDEVLIVSSSQQALDLVGRAFVEPGKGTKVLVESPTYLGALLAFNLSHPTYTELSTDEQGLNPDVIGDEVAGASFAYLIPTFQNPTGLTINEERRSKFAEVARKYNFLIVEDNPYGELYYGAERPPRSMRAFAPERTLRLGTMSKVLAPGFRIGYIVGPKEIIAALADLKSSMDLHTSTFTQLITARVLNEGLFTTHLPRVRKLYADKAHYMLECLDEFMPKHPGVSWTHPDGGMFIWVNLPEGLDSAVLMKKVLASDVPVGFVPGSAFYANKPEANHFRLSFVTVSNEKIRAGIKSIADALKTFL